MLTRSISDHKTDMLTAIDSWKDQADTDRVVAQVLLAARKIHTLDAVGFTGMVRKLLLVGMSDRAKRLVEVLSEREPTTAGLLAGGILVWAVKTVPLALVAALIAWLVVR